MNLNEFNHPEVEALHAEFPKVIWLRRSPGKSSLLHMMSHDVIWCFLCSSAPCFDGFFYVFSSFPAQSWWRTPENWAQETGPRVCGSPRFDTTSSTLRVWRTVSWWTRIKQIKLDMVIRNMKKHEETLSWTWCFFFLCISVFPKPCNAVLARDILTFCTFLHQLHVAHQTAAHVLPFQNQVELGIQTLRSELEELKAQAGYGTADFPSHQVVAVDINLEWCICIVRALQGGLHERFLLWSEFWTIQERLLHPNQNLQQAGLGLSGRRWMRNQFTKKPQKSQVHHTTQITQIASIPPIKPLPSSIW